MILMDQIQTAKPEATSEVPEADASPTIKVATCSLCFKEPSNEQIAEQLISSSFGKIGVVCAWKCTDDSMLYMQELNARLLCC